MKDPRAILILALTISAAGFGAGYGIGAGGSRSPQSEDSAQAVGSDRPVLSALPGRKALGTAGGAAGGALKRISREPGLALFVRMRAYLRLVNSVPIDQFPALLADIQRELPEEMGGESMQKALIRRWAKEDPQSLFTAFLQSESSALEDFSEDIVGGMVHSDPDQAWSALLEISSTQRRTRLVGVFLRTIGEEDPQAAMELARGLPDAFQYRSSIGEFFRNWANRDPMAALDGMAEFPAGMAREDFYVSAFSKLAEVDRQQAFKRFENLQDERARLQTLPALVGALVGEDPDAAHAWVLGLKNVEERDYGLIQMVENLAKTDPASAAAQLAKLKSPASRAHQVRSLADSYFRSDPAAALTWADEQLDGRARRNAQSRLLERHGEHMEFSQQLALANKIPGDGRDRRTFIGRWARSDPAAAAAWAGEQGQAGRRLIGVVYMEWGRADLDAAEASIGSIADERLRVAAAQQIKSAREQAAMETGSDAN